MAVDYKAIGTTGSSFKQPRQKMWGVFSRPNVQNASSYWELVMMSNDFKKAKEAVNNWLQNPPTGQYAKPGINNVILCEIVPVDSDVRV
jgi:hypothetical protein